MPNVPTLEEWFSFYLCNVVAPKTNLVSTSYGPSYFGEDLLKDQVDFLEISFGQPISHDTLVATASTL